MSKFSLSSLKQGKIILLLLMFMLLGFLFFMNQERERKIIYKGAAGEEKEAFLARGAYESLEGKSKEMLSENQGKTAEEKKEKQEANKKEKKEENPKISKEESKEESKAESEEESKAESEAEIGVDGEKTDKEAGIEDSQEKIQQNREEKKININTATEQELESLKGIGPATAKNIIRYREEYGGFSSIEEIKNVKRIGDKIFEKIVGLQYICYITTK